MADLSKTIQIIFDAVDNTGTAITSVGTGLDKLSGNVQKVTGPLAGFTDKLLLVEAGLAAAGAAMLKVAVDDAISLDDALKGLQKVMDSSQGSARDYLPIIDELSLKFGESSVTVTDMAADWVAAGFKIQDVFGTNGGLGLVAGTLEAVKVGGIDAGTAAQSFLSILQGLGEGVAPLQHVIDVANQLENVSGASFPQMVEALSLMTGAAKNAGFSFDEMAGYLVPVIEYTHSGTEAATAMRTILARFADDTKPMQAALVSLGVSQQDLNAHLLSAKDILDLVAKKWPSLTDNLKEYYANELAGKNQMNEFIALMDHYGEALQMTATATNAAGSASKELEIALSSAKVIAEQNAAAWEQLSQAIGGQILVNFSGATQATKDLAVAMRDAVNNNQLAPFFELIRPLLDDFSAGIEQIAKNLPEALNAVDWSKLQAVVKDLGGSFGELFSGIDLTTAQGLTKALQAIIDGLAGLTQWTSGVVTAWAPFVHALLEGGNAFAALPPDIQKTMGELSGFASAIDKLAGATESIGKILQGLGYAMGLLPFGAVAASAKTFTTAVGTTGVAGAAGAAGSAISGMIAAFAGYQLGKYVADTTGLGDAIERLTRSMTGMVDYAVDPSVDSLQRFNTQTGLNVDSMEEFNQAVDSGLARFNDATGQWERGGTAIYSLQDDILKAAAAGEKFGDSADSAGSGAQQLADKVQTTGTSFSSLMDQLQKAGASVSSAGTGLATLGGSASQAAAGTQSLLDPLTKLASDERLKNMEFKVKIDTEAIKADAETAKATIQSISDTITSTGTLLGKLFDLLVSDKASSYADTILEQIKTENEYRKQAVDLQQKFTEAQIAYMEAKTDALRKDDALIKIDGDGLKPHLEAFMWEILSAIQTRVNSEGLELLLGAA